MFVIVVDIVGYNDEYYLVLCIEKGKEFLYNKNLWYKLFRLFEFIFWKDFFI